ncbi:MAG TPA: hypothetical protein VGN00_23030 [Puia sp.]|jgi:uncharacterized repeat protein (TIGR01451 family)
MKDFMMLLLAGLVTGFIACKKSSPPAPAPAADSDREITMTVDNTTPVTGTNVTFTLVAHNNGPSATTDISVSDILPTGYTLVSATATTGSYTASTWSGFGLASGESATLTIVAMLKATGIYANTAAITGVGNDPVPGNNSVTVTTTPTVPKILMVSTLAGSTQGYMDGTGVAAQFSNPRGLGTDGAGNVYVVDHSNSRIRKISPAGVVTTLAGSTNGYADGMGAAAKFNNPNSLAVDAAGNIYVADAGNHRIRKITPAGMVSTLAGDGYTSTFYQPLGVAVDAAGNVYVADTDNSRICKVSASGVVTVLAGSAAGGGGSAGYADGMGTAAKFNGPNGVVVDASGNVYVTDARNYLIRKITPGGSVSTLAGSTQGYAEGTGAAARFENLTGPCIDAAGNIYAGDIGNNRIRKITPGGMVSSVAGGAPLGYADGPVATALFANPYATAVDAVGNIYVADVDNNVIRKIGY